MKQCPNCGHYAEGGIIDDASPTIKEGRNVAGGKSHKPLQGLANGGCPNCNFNINKWKR